MQTLDFEIRGEFIPLDALLKATGLASSGGHAKTLIVDGAVLVDGQPDLRRSAKMRPGQVIEVAGTRITLRAAPEA